MLIARGSRWLCVLSFKAIESPANAAHGPDRQPGPNLFHQLISEQAASSKQLFTKLSHHWQLSSHPQLGRQDRNPVARKALASSTPDGVVRCVPDPALACRLASWRPTRPVRCGLAALGERRRGGLRCMARLETLPMRNPCALGMTSRRTGGRRGRLPKARESERGRALRAAATRSVRWKLESLQPPPSDP